ncbi:hypothetical protein CAC42_1750 [Sphaceloma murrayae]|uniref:Zn(2)-C6 fungal-type domain-containing protein n=1 Tax=Sphaceloma murrayae TaxID=2082308 RepID=A0A2K1QHU9_9PEZI|nr:hypothetical protein CAC42_1750 [Sphaceloma murrayae]
MPKSISTSSHQASGVACKSDRSTKRIVIDIACIECRRRKKKCDGVKPCCSLCVDTGRACTYPVDSATAIRKDNKRLRDDLSALEAIFQLIRGASAEDAAVLVREIQSGRELHDIALPETCPSSEPTSGSSTYSDKSSQSPAVKRRKLSHLKQSGVSSGVASDSSASTPSTSLCDSVRSGPTPQPPDTRQVFVQFVSTYRGVIADAMAKFNGLNGNIFYTYTQQQVQDLCETLSRTSPDQVDNVTLCEICSIAAVAGHFSRDKIDASMLDLYYSVAKQTLDDCIVTRPLRAMKVACLLSMYNIVVKATAALAFVHIGLSITKYQGLERKQRPDWWDEMEWIDAKKVSRSLFFVKGWMEAALGFTFAPLPVVDPLTTEDVFSDPFCTELETEDFFQREMTKISVQKAEIMRIASSDDITAAKLVQLRRKLHLWYDRLPTSMHLANLLTAKLTPKSRMTLMYMHLYHLGAVMLLQRKVFSQAFTDSHTDNQDHWRSADALQLVKEGFIAGRQGARILSLMQDEDRGLSRQCWIVIFHAFITATTALFCTFQRINTGQSPAHWFEDAYLARRAFRALLICAEVDTVARELQARLEPYLSLLHSIEVAQAQSALPCTAPTQVFTSDPFFDASPEEFAFTLVLPRGQDAAHLASRDLADLICEPTSNKSSRSTHLASEVSGQKDTCFKQSHINLDEVGIGAHVEWDWFALNSQKPQQAGSRSLPPDSRSFGSFQAGSQPCGWLSERSTKDYLEGATTLEPLSSPEATAYIT